MAKPIYAWCVELRTKMTITMAQELSAATDDKDGRQFEFRCADDDCRDQLNPLIIGINYYKKKGSYKRDPYFKRGDHSVSKHISSCEGHQDIIQMTQGAKKRVQASDAIKMETARIIFKYDASTEDILSTTKSTHLTSPNGSSKIRHSSTGTGDTSRKTSNSHYSDINKMVHKFNKLSENEKKITWLDWKNAQKQVVQISFFDLFQPVSCFDKDNFHNRIFFGKAKVTVMNENYYSLWFEDDVLIEGFNNNIPCKLPVWIRKDENNGSHILKLLQTAFENTSHPFVTLYFIPTGIREMSNQLPRFLISNKFNHLALS